MPFHHTIALNGANSNDAITHLLGGVAIFAFLGIAGYILQIYLRESVRTAGRKARLASASAMEEVPVVEEEKSIMHFDEDYGTELKKLEKGFKEFYDDSLEQTYLKFEDLVKHAGLAFNRISEAYGFHGRGEEGEDRQIRVGRYVAVCSKQWEFFKSELYYLSYSDVEKHLRHILESYKLMESAKVQKDGDESYAEVSSEMLRSQDIVSLVRVVNKKHVFELQEDMLEAIESFREYYELHVRSWLNDYLFKVIGKMKEKGDRGLTIVDTGMESEYKHLKNCMETVARLSERISQRTQKFNDEGIILSQIVYVGTVLSVLSELNDWFPQSASAAETVA